MVAPAYPTGAQILGENLWRRGTGEELREPYMVYGERAPKRETKYPEIFSGFTS